MKTENEKKIDDIFSAGLQHPDNHSAYMEDDWNAMEGLLNKHKKRPAIIYWLPVLSGVAALLLIIIGWWLLKPPARQHAQQVASRVNTQKINTDTTKQVSKAPDTNQQIAAMPGALKPATINNTNKGTAATQSFLALKQSPKHPANDHIAVSSQGVKNKPAIIASDAKLRPDTVMIAQNTSMQKPVQPAVGDNKANTSQLTANIQPDAISVAPKANTVASNKAKPKAAMAYHTQFALSVIGSTDQNGVSSFQQTSAGNTVGLLFSAGVSKRFTFSMGAVYSSKPYLTNFANYHTAYQFSTDPLSIRADCRVLDIPLNVDYSLFSNYRNKLSIGSGLSSYIMLRERYNFSYAEGVYNEPASYVVPNTNKYILGVLNLQATYERQINSKFGLSVEPFMKIPLTNIGASQVKLQTTGLAVGLTWNLNSTSNP